MVVKRGRRTSRGRTGRGRRTSRHRTKRCLRTSRGRTGRCRRTSRGRTGRGQRTSRGRTPRRRRTSRRGTKRRRRTSRRGTGRCRGGGGGKSDRGERREAGTAGTRRKWCRGGRCHCPGTASPGIWPGRRVRGVPGRATLLEPAGQGSRPDRPWPHPHHSAASAGRKARVMAAWSCSSGRSAGPGGCRRDLRQAHRRRPPQLPHGPRRFDVF